MLTINYASLSGQNDIASQKKTRLWTNVALLLGHGLRSWPNIIPTLKQALVFTEVRLMILRVDVRFDIWGGEVALNFLYRPSIIII